MDIDLKPLGITGSKERPLIIAGPCAAETENQLIETAEELKGIGCKVFRAGVWKPRTKPGGFEGIGTQGLKWLAKVKDRTGMLTATEVATKEHVKQALKYNIDILWIGARTSSDPFAVQQIADSLEGVDIPVLVKNPLSPDIELWTGALERLNRAGIKRLGVIHRGFSFYGNSIYRNEPIWSVPIELHRRIPNLPIITDPSHIGGDRNLIETLCQQAMDLGFDGLIIESHINPNKALSDANQQITPNKLKTILKNLIIREENIINDELSNMRKIIDDLDDRLMEILAKRMEVCREIGRYKKDHNMTIRQSDRYNEILKIRNKQSESSGISQKCIKKIFESIHEESVRQQIEL